MRLTRLKNRFIILLILFICGILFIIHHLSFSFSSANQQLNSIKTDETLPKFTKFDKLQPIRIADVKSEKKNVEIKHDVKPDKDLALRVKSQNGIVDSGKKNNLTSNRSRRKVKSSIVSHKHYGSIFADSRYPILKDKRFIPTNRIFHLDLKGAPPKVPFFRTLFPFLKKIGATGVLFEWEDMFPYEGILESVRNINHYSKVETRQILQWANDAQLDIIPLVQTFGHLEWILKFDQFAQYRQEQRYPQVICLADEDAVNIVKTALNQVLDIHKEFPMPFFHIGADEAFQVGMCQKDMTLLDNELNGQRERLMLRHIADIAGHVIDRIDTRVLMWHDMLNNVETDLMNEYNYSSLLHEKLNFSPPQLCSFRLGELVEPVVWSYAENLDDQLSFDMWERFATVFPFIWGASAYKGADGPDRYYSNVPHYLANHQSWTRQMTGAYGHFQQFRGLIFTGWQRFDHFAVLCELLPVGLMSATINLLAIKRGHFDERALKDASKLLDCSSTLDINFHGVAAFCTFPGSKVYQDVQQLRSALEQVREEIYNDHQTKAWLSEFNIRHNYSQNCKNMAPIFFPDAIDEFLFEYVEPDLQRLVHMKKSAQRLSSLKVFPKRPFQIKIGIDGQFSKRQGHRDDEKRNW